MLAPHTHVSTVAAPSSRSGNQQQQRLAAMPQSKEVARITDKAQSYLDQAQQLVAEYGKVTSPGPTRRA